LSILHLRLFDELFIDDFIRIIFPFVIDTRAFAHLCERDIKGVVDLPVEPNDHFPFVICIKFIALLLVPTSSQGVFQVSSFKAGEMGLRNLAWCKGRMV